MIAPTQTQLIQVAASLRGVAATSEAPASFAPAVDTADDTEPFRAFMLDGKSVLASLLAVLIFAPGCAAATVFLMRADDRVAPMVAPRLTAPSIAKSDRLPPDHWSPDAVEMLLGPKGEARIDSATVFEDPAIIDPMAMRGSITGVSDDIGAVADAMAMAPRPKPKREARRIKPAKLVAEIVPPPEPPPPPPGFLEKLFGTQAN